MKLKEQQEQINMLIELANNLTEREGDRQKFDKTIENVISLQKIVCQRLDYIENFLDQSFGENDEERIKQSREIFKHIDWNCEVL